MSNMHKRYFPCPTVSPCCKYSFLVAPGASVFPSASVFIGAPGANVFPRCKCLRCLDPLEALSFTSAVACLRCKNYKNHRISYLYFEHIIEFPQVQGGTCSCPRPHRSRWPWIQDVVFKKARIKTKSKTFRNWVGLRWLWYHQVWRLDIKAEWLLLCSHHVRGILHCPS